MAFNINDFKAQGLDKGGARPSLFEIEIPNWPGSLPNATRKTAMLARSASLPPSIIESIDVPYMGRKIKIVGDRIFPAWNVTIMNDEDFLLRRSFENWHQSLNMREENVMFNNVTTNPESYKVNIIVKQLSKDGTNQNSIEALGDYIYVYTLVGAFPTFVDQIPLDFEATNRIEEFNVEFQYDYWEPREIREGSGFNPSLFQGARVNA